MKPTVGLAALAASSRPAGADAQTTHRQRRLRGHHAGGAPTA